MRLLKGMFKRQELYILNSCGLYEVSNSHLFTANEPHKEPFFQHTNIGLFRDDIQYGRLLSTYAPTISFNLANNAASSFLDQTMCQRTVSTKIRYFHPNVYCRTFKIPALRPTLTFPVIQKINRTSTLIIKNN